ncbi:hypothetical protein VHA01S_030_00140 [Vibrio halioticoli NBRC 102217]|uniref:DUF2726 domain-containing protein n=1 Tax=Vibrio halioticoli NBRC 102217 TaxID=1219072 RepID=V5F412_9VIBR|nr:DUF2726 domain-containing protein [Vibrio halioticoli]GAD89939.1 hypothetical protein VHA01S_030_00140 [Vibrio halioticoli NBRC 102217]
MQVEKALDLLSSQNLIYLLFALLMFTGVVFLMNTVSAFKHKYKPISNLNTKTEQKFYLVLKSMFNGHQFDIAQKVRLADIILPRNPKDITSFNKISRKHIDFVITDSKTSKILCAIELDDRSHLTPSALKRDKVKNIALKSAGVTFFRVKTGTNYSQQINMILADLSNSSIGYKKEKRTKSNMGSSCPNCNSIDYKKINMKWPNKGKSYFECSDCSFTTVPITENQLKAKDSPWYNPKLFRKN